MKKKFVVNHGFSSSLKVRSDLIPSPPTYNTKYGYLNWESYYNVSYYTRLLPPVPEDCPLPLGTKGETNTKKRFSYTGCYSDNGRVSLLFDQHEQIMAGQ